MSCDPSPGQQPVYPSVMPGVAPAGVFPGQQAGAFMQQIPGYPAVQPIVLAVPVPTVPPTQPPQPTQPAATSSNKV